MSAASSPRRKLSIEEPLVSVVMTAATSLGNRDVFFVLWESRNRSVDWFASHASEILGKLDSLHVHEDYIEAFDLHQTSLRNSPENPLGLQLFLNLLNPIDLEMGEGRECRSIQYLGTNESLLFHVLFATREGADLVLRGSLIAVIDEDLPAKWVDVPDLQRAEFFEVRVPFREFSSAYSQALADLELLKGSTRDW